VPKSLHRSVREAFKFRSRAVREDDVLENDGRAFVDVDAHCHLHGLLPLLSRACKGEYNGRAQCTVSIHAQLDGTRCKSCLLFASILLRAHPLDGPSN